MTALRLPAAGNLWRTQRYYPWTAKRNGGMLESLKVGLSEGAGERLNRSYAYNYFGDITALTEETTSNSFTYDGLGRLMDSSCTVSGGLIHGVGYGLPGWGTDTITSYAQTNRWEYWAEAVADWVYKDLYSRAIANFQNR